MKALRRTRLLLALLAVLAAAASPGCRQLTREATTPYPEGWPRAAPWRLDPALLLPEGSERILFLVEVNAGREPDEEALDRLAGLASRYGGRPASWLHLGEEGAPAGRPHRPAHQCPAAPGIVLQRPHAECHDAPRCGRMRGCEGGPRSAPAGHRPGGATDD